MGEISPPEPVKLFVGVIYRAQHLDAARRALRRPFGEIDAESEPIPFDFTDYYEHEMGKGLWRVFLSFARLVDPGRLAEIKTATNRIESRFRDPAVARPVNLDPGYLTEGGIVLASTKPAAHRICVGGEIYAELTLVYERGAYAPLPWTYPDFRTDAYGAFFQTLRKRYMNQMRRFRRKG